VSGPRDRDGWRVWVDATGTESPGANATWTAAPADASAWRARVAALAATTPWHRSKHAMTYRVPFADGDLYVKRYSRYRLRTTIKDLLRPSKARHVRTISAALSAAGFRVPRVLACAERRRGPLLLDAWVATAGLIGVPLADRLVALHRAAVSTTGAGGARGDDVTAGRAALATKRALLASLGAEVARLHERGFVAGDLVAPNVWLVGDDANSAIAFLDHDRTQAGRRRAPWRRARRNLVQLNRIPIAGVLVTDRLRVYRAYAAGRRWSYAAARRRLPWVITKTIERRRLFDHVDDAATLGFRALMRAERRCDDTPSLHDATSSTGARPR
jgi:hypothetical protein